MSGVTAGDGQGNAGDIVGCRVGCLEAVTVGISLDVMSIWWRTRRWSAVGLRGRGESDLGIAASEA